MTQTLRTTTSDSSRRVTQFSKKRRASGTSTAKRSRSLGNARTDRSRSPRQATVSQAYTTKTAKSQPSRRNRLELRRRARQKPSPTNLWQPRPWWLRLLQQGQRSSSLIAFVLAIAACIAYAYATHYQQRWSQVYQQTEQLRTEEQQLHAYQELLKNQVASDAQTEKTELVPPDPNQILFVEPAPVREFQPSPQPEPEADPSQPVVSEPLGY